MPKKYVVQLSEDQRGLLYALTQKGNAPARTVRRAHTLLLADEQQPAQTIAAMLQSSAVTVTQTCKQFLTTGLKAALYDQPRPGSRRKLDGRQGAHLVAVACSTPPAGRARWSLRLLADRIVELGIVETVSSATVRRVLKKTRSSHGCKSNGVSPRRVPSSSPGWKTCSTCTKSPMIPRGHGSASMSAPVSCSAMAWSPCPCCQGIQHASTTHTAGTAPVISL